MTLANYGNVTNTKARLAMEQAKKEVERTKLRRDLVEILEDSKCDLARVLIMERMGSFVNEKALVKCLPEIKKADEQITNIQKGIISELLIQEVQAANRDIKAAGGYNQYGTIMLNGSTRGYNNPYYNGVSLLDTNKFQFSKFNKSELDSFFGMWNDLKAEALKIAKDINLKRQIHIDGWKKCLGELARQEFILDKDAIKYKWCSSKNYDHIDVLEVYYEDTKVSDQIINLLEDIQNFEAHWKKNTQRLIDSVYKNSIRERKTEIQSQIKEMCNSFGFEEARFVLLKDKSKPYSFEGESYLSASIDFTKPDVYANFKRDLRNAIATIIYMTEKCQATPGKLDIVVGDAYHFKYFGEKKLIDDTYSVYESKIGKNKPLLQVFKNGKRLWGRGRVKALKLLGIGRNGKIAKDMLRNS